MIVKKRLKRIFDVNVHGIVFTFRTFEHEEQIEWAEAKTMGARTKVILKALTKITPNEFEDGSPLNRNTVYELDDEILFDLYTAWVKESEEIARKINKEREQTQNFTNGSPQS